VTVQALVSETVRLGIHLTAAGDRLRYEAPCGVVTPAIRSALVASKSDLLAVVWRLDAMRQLARTAPRPTAYARATARGGPGHCFSCGDDLGHPDAFGRCGPCDVASDVFYATRRADENERVR
jgi:hypothetical protein